jgi:hypothetical protein
MQAPYLAKLCPQELENFKKVKLGVNI